MVPRRLRTVLFALVASLAAAPAAAQTVRGTVAEDGAGRPLNGALVVLLDAEGRQVGGTIANATGGFSIDAPTPGRFQLRVQRIGFQNTTTPAFELRAGEVRVENIRASVAAVVIEGITAQARRRCVLRPEQGVALASLWEEIRKALDATAVSERAGMFDFRTRRHERNLDPVGLRVRDETARVTSTRGSQSPYVSLAPGELTTRGFVTEQAGLWEFAAPDARTLVSEEFLDNYCFRLAGDHPQDPSLIGLTFEPAGRSGPPGVRGTLWVDRTTNHLQYLEFDYTRTPFLDGVPRRAHGGRVEFEALPSGAWIVRRWWIRMPLLAVAGAQPPGPGAPPGIRTQRPLVGIRETGGEVLDVVASGGSTVRVASTASLRGIVYDSTRAAPLAGATVFLSGTAFATTADEEGRFLLEELPEGSFSVGFRHPALEALGIEPPLQPVSLPRGGTTETALAVPPGARAEALLARCPEERAAARQLRGSGVAFGRVTDRLTGQPLPRAEVTVTWKASPTPGAVTENTWMTVTADGGGRYLVCGLPTDRVLTLTSTFMGRTLTEEIPPLARVALAERDLALSVVAPTRIAGRVTDPETRQPVVGARIALGDGAAETLTDRSGRFVLEGVAPGQHVLEVRHLGFGTRTQPVDVSAEGADLELAIRRAPVELEGIEVTVRSAVAEARRARGASVNVLTRDDIAQLASTAVDVGDAVRRLPGVRVRYIHRNVGGTISGLCVESTRGAVSTNPALIPGRCEPVLLVLDGVPTRDPEAYRSLSLHEIESIEFVNALEAGLLYGTDSARGVLVIFTRGNGPYAQRSGVTR